MRTRMDRIRHTLLFEAVLMVLLILILPPLLGVSVQKIGGLSVIMSMLAMGSNFAYNVMFDKILLALGKPLLPRPFITRAVHAVCFELLFAALTIPVIMWWLNFTFIEAIIYDAGFLVGIPVYAFLFNLTYDTVFPLPQHPVPAEQNS
ncbi:transmembrane pair domain-containing protein [Oleidesulfovibrio alaskensis G20]|uniref:Transmembrane pair domain-containing protein n=2 Tax=Oleidesulfovibrio alaskensis TaxID=58180 RepID=Q316J7_OLEA2|nr:PACE efflux transporter [Oleidesulfovibrio alaskensis]ABB37149.1 transmembrane pair domain-containing protein [Oleidesulfovibrio alaskensis G20]MBG0774799.1 PACE efflux transporter [Oleidesulfovibrio alaskensis]